MRLALEEWGDPGAERVPSLHGTGATDAISRSSRTRWPAATSSPASSATDRRPTSPVGPRAPPRRGRRYRRRRPACLVGHSFGGRLAFEPRLACPEARPAPRPARPRGTRAARGRALRGGERPQGALVCLLRRRDRPPLRGEPAHARAARDPSRRRLRHLVQGEDDRFRYRYSQAAVVAAPARMASEPPPFEQVRVPTLLVLGETSYLC